MPWRLIADFVPTPPAQTNEQNAGDKINVDESVRRLFPNCVRHVGPQPEIRRNSRQKHQADFDERGFTFRERIGASFTFNNENASARQSTMEASAASLPASHMIVMPSVRLVNEIRGCVYGATSVTIPVSKLYRAPAILRRRLFILGAMIGSDAAIVAVAILMFASTAFAIGSPG